MATDKDNALGYRTFQVRADKDTGALRGILTTEQPVAMFDWERFEYIPEVLLMSGMKARGLTVKLLDTHNTSSVRNVLGSYKALRTHGADGRADFGYVDGELEFSSVEQDVATKVREGHVNEMSVGYQTSGEKTIYVGKGETLEHEGKTYEGPMNLRTQWRLNEASVVPLGADDQAQIKGFRSMQDALSNQGRTPEQPEPNDGEHGGDAVPAKPAREGSRASEGEEKPGKNKEDNNRKPMSEEKTPVLSDAERAQIVKEGADAENVRQNAINDFERFASASGLGDDEAKSLADKYRKNGQGDKEAYRELAQNSRFNQAPSHTEPEAHAPLGLNEKEKQSYSFIKAIGQLASPGGKLDGLEREVSDAIAERTGRSPDGFFAAGARDLTAGTATDGAEIVATDLRSGDFIDVLRPNMVSRQLGIRVLNGLTSDVSIPRKTSASAASWVGDENTTAHSESEPQFDAISLTPNHLGCFTDISKQLLHQGTPDAEALVRDDLNQAISVALDAAVFKGSGTAQPQGVVGATGVLTSTIAAAAAPVKAEIFEFLEDLDTGNALTGSLAWVTTPAMRSYLAQLLIDSGVGGHFWDMASNTVLGYAAHSTSQLAANSIVFGNWTDYILGVFDGVDIVVDPYGDNAKKRMITLTVNLMADGDVRRPASFCTNA